MLRCVRYAILDLIGELLVVFFKLASACSVAQ
jgi:hypothetical protein